MNETSEFETAERSAGDFGSPEFTTLLALRRTWAVFWKSPAVLMGLAFLSIAIPQLLLEFVRTDKIQHSGYFIFTLHCESAVIFQICVGLYAMNFFGGRASRVSVIATAALFMVFVPYSFKLAADVSFALGEIFSRFVGEYFVFYIELTLVFVMSPIMIFLNGFQDQLLRAEHLSFFQVLQVIKRGNMLLRGRNLKICAVAVAAWAAIFLSILLPFLAVRLISPSRVVRMIFVLVSASPAAAFFYLLPVATYYSLRSERETRELSEIFD